MVLADDFVFDEPTGSHASSSLSTTVDDFRNRHPGLGEKSSTSNGHLFLVVQIRIRIRRTPKSWQKTLLDSILMFSILRSIRSDPETECTVEVVQPLCRWLEVLIDFGLVDHAWEQGSVERFGVWIHEALDGYVVLLFRSTFNVRCSV